MTNVGGCGISGGVRTGSHLARLIRETGDVSIGGLWPAVHRFYTGIGAKAVGERPWGLVLSKEKRHFLYAHGLIGPSMAQKENPLLNPDTDAWEAPTYLEAKNQRPDLILKLEKSASAARRKLTHYLNFPETWNPVRFREWIKEID
ncbi:MAG: hypothetical protein J6P72_05695 [Firmicutes bacterium]|nr:hypothetical protein [Bacillota bacterium]